MSLSISLLHKCFLQSYQIEVTKFSISHINFQGQCSADKDRKNVLLQAVLYSRNVTTTCEVHGVPSDTLQASPVVMKVLLFDTDFLLCTI